MGMTEPGRPAEKPVDREHSWEAYVEAFLKEPGDESLPEECKRIDPEKEIELQKWILRMTLEAV